MEHVSKNLPEPSGSKPTQVRRHNFQPSDFEKMRPLLGAAAVLLDKIPALRESFLDYLAKNEFTFHSPDATVQLQTHFVNFRNLNPAGFGHEQAAAPAHSAVGLLHRRVTIDTGDSRRPRHG